MSKWQSQLDNFTDISESHRQKLDDAERELRRLTTQGMKIGGNNWNKAELLKDRIKELTNTIRIADKTIQNLNQLKAEFITS